MTPRGAPTGGRAATLARGLLAGAVALPVLLPLTPPGQALLDAALGAVGPTHPEPWRWALWGMALGLPPAFALLGYLGHALARPGAASMGGVVLSLLAVAVLGGGEALVARRMLDRYDEGRDLSRLTGIARGASSTYAFLIFPPAPEPGPRPGLLRWVTIQGLDAGHDSPGRAWEYLRRREFQSVAAGDAFVHLHDCASLAWDSAESLRVDLANLEQNPRPIFSSLLLEKLSTCAISPENRALLRRAAEPSRFRLDPDWQRSLALLFWRFGDRPAAERLLRQAGLGPAEVRQMLAGETPLTTGAVTGRLMVDGRPGAGLAVGLLPVARWPMLIGGPPFEHRWVGAAAPTEADGRFHLRDLGAGDYVLIVRGDGAHLPLRDAGVRAAPSPGALRLDRRHPARDLGTIRIATHENPRARLSRAALDDRR